MPPTNLEKSTVTKLAVDDLIPQSTDTQFLARDTLQCARSTLVIVVQVRDRAWFVRLYGR